MSLASMEIFELREVKSRVRVAASQRRIVRSLAKTAAVDVFSAQDHPGTGINGYAAGQVGKCLDDDK